MKKCTAKNCVHKGKLLSSDMFYKKTDRKDSLDDVCKDCRKVDATRYNKKLKENREMFQKMFL